MAKQRSFFDKFIQKLKRDAGAAWTGDFIEDIRSTSGLMVKKAQDVPRDLVGDGFFTSLQQEAVVRGLDEMAREELDVNDDKPLVHPGLMAAWEAAPVTLEFDRDLMETVIEAEVEFLGTPLSRVRELFPACLFVDVRPWNINLYEASFEGLFIYPSYDADRRYEVLVVLAVGLKLGLDFTLESKIVLKGETLGDAVNASIAERELLRGRCLAGIDHGMHNVIYSPFEDEERIMWHAVDALGLLMCDYTVVERMETRKGVRLHAMLAEPEPAPNAPVGTPLRASAAPASEPAPAAPAPDPAPEPESAPDAPATPEPDAPAPDPALEPAPDAPATPEPESAPDAPVGTPLRASAAPASEPAPIASNSAETESLRERIAELESKASSLEYHLKQARAAVESAQREAAGATARAAVFESMDLPASPADALALAERAFPDRLVVMPQARKSAAEFKKGDVVEVWAVLRSIACVLHPLVFGKSGGNIVRAFESEAGFELTFREMKMIKQTDEFARLRTVQYKGAEHDASAHVKGRGFKKGETLRVHFFADYSENKIVITHCGEHLETYVTSSK